MSDTNDDGFERRVVFVGGTGNRREGFQSQKYTPWVHWGYRYRFWTIGIYQKELIFKTERRKLQIIK